MKVNINPEEWISEKEVQQQERRSEVVSLFNAYKEALVQAEIKASDTRIMLKVAEDVGLSLATVRNICHANGVVAKRERLGRPTMAV